MSILIEFMKVRTRISDPDLIKLKEAVENEHFRRLKAEEDSEALS